MQKMNLVPLQTKMSLPPEIITWLDMCATYRDGTPKQYPERHRVDVLRDILTAVGGLIMNSGYSDVDQAKMTKRLADILTLKEGINDDQTTD
ncbi:hypothetical protein ACFSR7_06195 [Cohnella sp. GCM10020058]